MDYLSLISKELIELLSSYINYDTFLEFNTYYNTNNLDYNLMFRYHFNFYHINNKSDYIRFLGIESLKNKLKLRYTIKQLINLLELDLSNSQLNHLPKEIGLLTNLQKLYLHKNRLPELPKEIGLLINLQILYLNNNQLNQLPKEIELLINLQKLDLGNNRLTQLPEEIGALINLIYLYLHNNLLTQLSEEISTLINLRSLFVSKNQLDIYEIRKIKQLLPNTNLYF